MFDFPKEKAKLIKQDSTVIENIEALFDGKTIFVDDSSVCIEEGDIFERTLPNGLKEQYLVTDRGFFSGSPGGIPAHYQVQVEKQSIYRKITRGQVINNYNITGSNNVNINSTDNSTTVYNLSSQEKAIFDELRKLTEQIQNNREEIQRRIDDMENHVGKKSFVEKYTAFIETAANHMTVFAPLLPSLMQFIPKG
jgi:gas vesicle protein